MYSIKQIKDLAIKISSFLEHGDIIALNGKLGAGKSTFSKFLIESLGFSYLGSPTFSKIITYNNENLQLWHADLYQAKNQILDEYIYDIDNGILIIEWANNYSNIKMLDNIIEVNISHLSKDNRNVELIKYGRFIKFEI
ncbi:tRNA (adenosine(37)-N6)-threonylcarbamoyltransferase complex ATPase subunit type 1 TsaE [Candidatus Cytomitobacter indipagum]|uniref:tRNA threonylcarbamoyladenosine biosynthesis protein TsaE n=1 Tax=Candidatus Cytomitobacter indipagum TaxID=2601575 RepID=A0A5C0UEL7_9PROT|nr:tRNA (adenosine(37)-N6)-threonylcarbamoyltransferase complex ATPase subunit type 1 TsaE [Candidatus Cytomitobacter indipagum]QEK38121.1 tRNA (adenosine(37)-N6)-threonylcarbamoyltransferase complex ATPase subunit type 1 TsaE [Candidatus Cytomitobacter indipagum]